MAQSRHKMRKRVHRKPSCATSPGSGIGDSSVEPIRAFLRLVLETYIAFRVRNVQWSVFCRNRSVVSPERIVVVDEFRIKIGSKSARCPALPGGVIGKNPAARIALDTARLRTVVSMPTTTVTALDEPESLSQRRRVLDEVPGTIPGAGSERALQGACEADGPVLLLVFYENGSGGKLENRQIQVPVNRAPTSLGFVLFVLDRIDVEVANTCWHAEHGQQTRFGEGMGQALAHLATEKRAGILDFLQQFLRPQLGNQFVTVELRVRGKHGRESVPISRRRHELLGELLSPGLGVVEEVAGGYDLAVNVGGSVIAGIPHAKAFTFRANILEGFREPSLTKEPFCDYLLTLGQKRRRRWLSCYPFRMPEIIQIVTLAPAHGHHERERLTSPASTAYPLLIIETLRWHVCLKHCLERTDVDTDLHGRCDG